MLVPGTYMYVPYIFCTEQYVPVHTSTYMYVLFFWFSSQVELINAAIDKAKKGSNLHSLPHVADPSEEIQEVLIACVEWNMETRAKDIPEADLPALQQKAVDLLDLLNKNLPDKTGEKAGWNFEKAHSILYKVSEIVLWGNTDNTSCQSPEVRT